MVGAVFAARKQLQPLLSFLQPVLRGLSNTLMLFWREPPTDSTCIIFSLPCVFRPWNGDDDLVFYQ